MNQENRSFKKNGKECLDRSHFEKNSHRDNKLNSNNLISIVIPVYNEEGSIKNVIERIPNNLNYETIIVDDGSTDNSVKKIHEIKNKSINLIQHKINRGYGAAVRTGFNHAKGNIVVTMDSDGQHTPDEIPLLLKPILSKQADLVVGSRYLGKCTYKVPLYTRTGEFFISLCLRLLFNQRVDNNQSGFRALNKKSLDILQDVYSNRFGLCTEMLFKAAYNKKRIIEVPITVDLRQYGTSYVRTFKIMKPIIFLIILYFLKKLLSKTLRTFIPKKILDNLYYIIIKPLRTL